MLGKKEKYGLWVFALCFTIAIMWAVSDNVPPFHSRTEMPSFEKEKGEGEEEEKEEEKKPNDWFFMQRAYPLGDIPIDQYLGSIQQAQQMREKISTKDAVVWSEAGPTNIPGRITDLAIHPDYPNTIYAGAACGGVFKSTDNGATWAPIFDDHGTPSIGALAIHPDDPSILYCGTGEANGSGDSYPGTGIYKSTDGGSTWALTGLENSYHIGRIVIDPLDPDNIFVAASGKLFGKNPDRGIYKSTNGGASWEQKLYISDSTAAIDVAVDPTNPNTVYAAMWERIRASTYRQVGGWTSGLHKSTDGGDTWYQLTSGLPSSGPDVGRIGISVCESSPNVLYAVYCDHPGYFMGMYKSTDYGESWTQTNDSALEDLVSSFGWYFGQVRVDPTDPDKVFAMGVYLYRTTNGGNFWSEVGYSVHVDHHAMFISPDDPSRVYLGCDGGVYLSSNGGTNWSLCTSQPSTQFYAITIDHLNPQRLYGGTQDNGTLRTLTGALGDWDHSHGGDGFYCNVDYTNANVIYAEYQWGWLRKSTNLGGSWNYVMDGIDDSDRTNWCTPVIMDPVDHNTLYYGSHRLYKTTNGGGWWDPISGDLTNGPGPGTLTYGTLTTIAVAPSITQVIYVGTDDANVWVTTNGGGDWTSISAGLPDRWVTRVAVDPYDESIAYATFSGHRIGGALPHVYRSTNYGSSWQSISSNLPEGPINDVIVDPMNPSVLYVGSDVGVYVTEDLGGSWAPLGTGLPVTTVHDLAFHPPTRKLVAGTHGRSMFSCQVPGSDTTHGVQVLAGDSVSSINADDVEVVFYLENTGLVADTFDITVDDALGWSLSPDSFSKGLAAGQIDTTEISVSVPYDVEPGTTDPITLQAISRGNPSFVDSAVLSVYVNAKRGDLDLSCEINVGDVVLLVNYLYRGGDPPEIPETGDANCDDTIDVGDVVILINYLFRSGPMPCAP
ncbi:MAG: glycosyl hydrolase [Candidatus Zixiibacteriota bacterium]|nr:MAG: glycosyl hydrolase [candidate division Zixibacteria bacterium]